MPKEEPEIKVEKAKDEGGGIKVIQTEAELAPPLTEEAEKAEAEMAEQEIAAKKVIGKMPILPGVIKPPLRFESLALQEGTGYPIPLYREEDLEDIASLIAELGLEMHPGFQVLLAMGGLHAAWFIGLMQWRRTGRKGDIRKSSETGEVAKVEHKGEETRA